MCIEFSRKSQNQPDIRIKYSKKNNKNQEICARETYTYARNLQNFHSRPKNSQINQSHLTALEGEFNN